MQEAIAKLRRKTKGSKAMTHEEHRKFAEANGWKYYEHAGDVFGMTDAEKQEMEFRFDLGKMIRKRREALGLSQQDLAKKLKISKRKVDEIEGGSWDTPLEEML